VQRQQHIIHTLQEGDHLQTQHKEKARILFQYFCKLMGTEVHSSIEFGFNTIFGTQQHINGFDGEITEQEIRQAINTWPTNKAAGPDGFPGEFYQ
jgi:hypothetical protein